MSKIDFERIYIIGRQFSGDLADEVALLREEADDRLLWISNQFTATSLASSAAASMDSTSFARFRDGIDGFLQSKVKDGVVDQHQEYLDLRKTLTEIEIATVAPLLTNYVDKEIWLNCPERWLRILVVLADNDNAALNLSALRDEKIMDRLMSIDATFVQYDENYRPKKATEPLAIVLLMKVIRYGDKAEEKKLADELLTSIMKRYPEKISADVFRKICFRDKNRNDDLILKEYLLGPEGYNAGNSIIKRLYRDEPRLFFNDFLYMADDGHPLAIQILKDILTNNTQSPYRGLFLEDSGNYAFPPHISEIQRMSYEDYKPKTNPEWQKEIEAFALEVPSLLERAFYSDDPYFGAIIHQFIDTPPSSYERTSDDEPAEENQPARKNGTEDKLKEWFDHSKFMGLVNRWEKEFHTKHPNEKFVLPTLQNYVQFLIGSKKYKDSDIINQNSEMLQKPVRFLEGLLKIGYNGMIDRFTELINGGNAISLYSFNILEELLYDLKNKKDPLKDEILNIFAHRLDPVKFAETVADYHKMEIGQVATLDYIDTALTSPSTEIPLENLFLAVLELSKKSLGQSPNSRQNGDEIIINILLSLTKQEKYEDRPLKRLVEMALEDKNSSIIWDGISEQMDGAKNNPEKFRKFVSAALEIASKENESAISAMNRLIFYATDTYISEEERNWIKEKLSGFDTNIYFGFTGEIVGLPDILKDLAGFKNDKALTMIVDFFEEGKKEYLEILLDIISNKTEFPDGGRISDIMTRLLDIALNNPLPEIRENAKTLLIRAADTDRIGSWNAISKLAIQEINTLETPISTFADLLLNKDSLDNFSEQSNARNIFDTELAGIIGSRNEPTSIAIDKSTFSYIHKLHEKNYNASFAVLQNFDNQIGALIDGLDHQTVNIYTDYPVIIDNITALQEFPLTGVDEATGGFNPLKSTIALNNFLAIQSESREKSSIKEKTRKETGSQIEEESTPDRNSIKEKRGRMSSLDCDTREAGIEKEVIGHSGDGSFDIAIAGGYSANSLFKIIDKTVSGSQSVTSDIPDMPTIDKTVFGLVALAADGNQQAKDILYNIIYKCRDILSDPNTPSQIAWFPFGIIASIAQDITYFGGNPKDLICEIKEIGNGLSEIEEPSFTGQFGAEIYYMISENICPKP